MAKPSSHKKNQHVGQYVDPHARGRLTKKSSNHNQASPPWYGPAILQLLGFGVITITLNYLQVLPGSTSPWYLLIGLVTIFGGFFMATNYR
jgi:hypothetical protein